MEMIMKHLNVILETLKDMSREEVGPKLHLQSVKTGYKTDNSFPTEGWKDVTEGQTFSGNDAHYWIRSSFATPEASSEHKYLILSMRTGREGLWDATNPQGLLYLNGKMTQGYDTNHTDAYLDYGTEYDMHNYFYIGPINDSITCDMRIYEVDRRIEKLYHDIRVPYQACLLLSDRDDDKITMAHILERCVDILDFRQPKSEAFFESLALADKFLWEEFYGKLCSNDNKPTVNCVGHTHIDVEWQWTRYQTMEKIQRSFATANALMERYPEFKFMLSQPELYIYLKKEAPEMYQRLKELVKEGRWEPEGAMLVESDCNLVSGESFVRQILFGKKFFKDEFGVDCKILFLPDVFGYSSALPQILKKSGIRHFVTSKISWNDTNTLPVDTFMWQGMDGTEIFTNFITAQGYSDPPKNGTTYVGMLSVSGIKGAWHRYSQKEYSRRALTTFGYGDGGGGPTALMLENYDRLKYGIPGIPKVEMIPLLEHLDKVREEFDANSAKLGKTPRWVGELYLEYHRGTYTSIAKNKRNNRKSELGLQMAETVSYTDLINGGSYDKDGINNMWHLVLHNQFHDIIPGSSIKEVYDLTDEDYRQVSEFYTKTCNDKLGTIASKIASEGGVFVYNPLGFERKAPFTLDGAVYETKETVPAFGWTVIKDVCRDNEVKVNGLEAENEYYRITLDNDGCIISLYDKKACRQVVREGEKLNQLQIFEDLPYEYDNWEISPYYKNKMWTIDGANVTSFIDGTTGGFIIEKKYMNSVITQTLRLYTDNPRIDFETEIDWHEHHQILKAAFPFDLLATSATYDVQYGHISRPTHENTSWDKAKFEVYGHKWVDMSENGYGVALLNDCKYGYNTEGSTLKLTMLKCGTFPNPEADQGTHRFTYSLMPHRGDIYSAGVIKEAYSLNQPLYAKRIGEGSGELPVSYSLVSVDSDNVIVETVKRAESSDDMVVRMYESFGRRCTATVSVPECFGEAYICDLLENEETKLDIVNGNVTVPVSCFEIITLKFKR